MKTVLYITMPGACVHQTHGRIRVVKGKELVQEIRIDEIERIVVLSGTAGVTSAAATCLMEAGIETAFLSSAGVFRGWLSPAKGRGARLRRMQLEAYLDKERQMAIARAIVAQKIRNGATLLARFERNHSSFDAGPERLRMAHATDAANQSATLGSLLGHEGEAAAAYFRAFGRMLGNGFTFQTRSRRPPRDAPNALLSFGYTLLSAEATGAVAGAGLDPAVGFLHLPDDGRPSLGLDLTEEFRQAVVDRVVLSLVNNRVLSAANDFLDTGSSGAYRMTDRARRVFLLTYETRMTEPVQPGPGREPVSLRESLRRQASKIARALADRQDYVPFVLR